MSLVMVTNNSSTDQNPPTSVATEAANAAQDATGMARTEIARETAAASGWNCNVTEVGGGLSFADCKTTVAAAGFVAVPVLNATVGYMLTPSFGLEGFVRYQLKHGSTSPGIGGGLRAEILLTEPQGEGFHAGLLGGVMLGALQAQAPKAAAAKVDAPYATSGLFGVQLGMRLGYHFTRSVGVVVTPVTNLMFGTFLSALDLNAALRFAF